LTISCFVSVRERFNVSSIKGQFAQLIVDELYDDLEIDENELIFSGINFALTQL